MSDDDIRPGEVTVTLPSVTDAAVYFIGRIHTPWTERGACPRTGDKVDGPECRIVVDRRWAQALTGLDQQAEILVLYWMNRARRDIVIQTPRHSGKTLGTFALRSPVRPNPIAASVVTLLGIEGTTLRVRGLDCMDGTPLLDIKPHRRPEPASDTQPAP